ncbi:hypothetical protein EON78_02450 [bacterium]|nr:MAG: hypothetical protein EON78_02450 [bacterium]
MIEEHELTFPDIVPLLTTLYRRGVLVPFLGAGMSRGVCCGWQELLENLASYFKITIPDNASSKQLNSAEMIRAADEIINRLRALKIEMQAEVLQNALSEKDKLNDIPKQISALASLYWPLVISTNYDDTYLCAKNKSNTNQSSIDILGRSIDDCHEVLHSLDQISNSKYWAIQGFLGGQLAPVESLIKDSTKRFELVSQVVLGHQQYQKAINSSLHFRRAFAEVYRRRSLIFLGSGIQEDYLINLFSEILHHQGCGPYPHFALLKKSSKDQYSNLFMQQRLGIVPIFYEDYEEVPKFLQQFSNHIKYWLEPLSTEKHPTSPVIFQNELAYSLSANSSSGTIPIKLKIYKKALPTPHLDLKECSIVSVGRFQNNPKSPSCEN